METTSGLRRSVREKEDVRVARIVSLRNVTSSPLPILVLPDRPKGLYLLPSAVTCGLRRRPKCRSSTDLGRHCMPLASEPSKWSRTSPRQECAGSSSAGSRTRDIGEVPAVGHSCRQPRILLNIFGGLLRATGPNAGSTRDPARLVVPGRTHPSARPGAACRASAPRPAHSVSGPAGWRHCARGRRWPTGSRRRKPHEHGRPGR